MTLSALQMTVLCLALLVPTAVRASDQDLVTIKARLDAAPLSDGRRSASNSYGSVGMIVFDVRDTRTFSSPARRKIVSIAVSGFGDVVGYVLKKNGGTICSFYGVTDGTCLAVAGCVSGTVCN